MFMLPLVFGWSGAVYVKSLPFTLTTVRSPDVAVPDVGVT